MRDRYQDYAREELWVLDQNGKKWPAYTKGEILWEAQDQKGLPLCCLIDLTPGGLLQYGLLRCPPFRTDGCNSIKNLVVKDIRDAKAYRSPSPARDGARLIEMLTDALLAYNRGCQELEGSTQVQDKVRNCERTVQWLAEMFPYLEEPLQAVIRGTADLRGLSVARVPHWLQDAPRVLDALIALPNAAYNNMPAPPRVFARSPLDYDLDHTRQRILGKSFPDTPHREIAPLVRLKNLLYTKRWPRPLDQDLLMDVLLARMRGSFRLYGPELRSHKATRRDGCAKRKKVHGLAKWSDEPIYAAMAAILNRFSIRWNDNIATITASSVQKRLQRLEHHVELASCRSRLISILETRLSQL